MMMSAGSTTEAQRTEVPSSKHQIKQLQKNFRKQTGRGDIEATLLRLSKEYRSFLFYAIKPRVVLVLAEPEMIKFARKYFKLSVGLEVYI